MDSRQLWNALRYVERNPVRAGLARQPEEYVWSSARAHLRGERDGVTDLVDWASHWTTEGWREFVNVQTTGDDELIRQNTHSGRPLGSQDFVARLESQLKRRLTTNLGGRPKKCVEAAATLV